MNPEHILTLASGAGFLALGASIAMRARKTALALPLAILCLVLFAYNALEAVGKLAIDPTWSYFESFAAALAAPLLLHFILVFVGTSHHDQRKLLVAYVYFIALGASCTLPIWIPTWSDYPGGIHWAELMLIGLLPTFGLAARRLRDHYLAQSDSDERARTQLVVLATSLGVGGVSTDLLAIAGAQNMPELAPIGMLLGLGSLALLVFRFQILAGGRRLLAINAILISALGVGAGLLLIENVSEGGALWWITSLSVFGMLIAAGRSVYTDFIQARERAHYLATLGRFSSQMAHDLRNPLAAIHGAAQFLQEDMKGPQYTDDQREFIDLIVEQSQRMERVIADYRRLGKAELQRASVDVHALLHDMAKRFSGMHEIRERKITIHTDVASPLDWSFDRELIQVALENFIRNAAEAFDESDGTIQIAAAVQDEQLKLVVEDDGPGMDARTRQQAISDFFTTKAQGSGLGLAFARRIAEAHGGRLQLDSELGHGTRVSIFLPMVELHQ